MATVLDSDHNIQQKQRNKKEETVEVEQTKSLSPFALSQPLANYTEASAITRATSDNTTTNADSTATAVYDVEHLATFSTAGSHEGNNRSATTNNNDGSDGSQNAASGLRELNDTREPARTAIGTTTNTTTSALTTATTTNTTPKLALQRLFELEKLSGIWTQRMQIELRSDFMLIVDCETSSVVERFERGCVIKAEAFSHYNDIYNNIVVFLINPINYHYQATSNGFERDNNSLEHRRRRRIKDDQNDNEEHIENENCSTSNRETGELHIFHCVSHKAQQIISDILVWKLQSSSNLGQIMANNNQAITTNQDKTKTGLQSDSPLPSQANKQQVAAGLQSVKKSSAASNSDKPVVTVASSTGASESVPIINVNVKETVQVFNQIAALREKRPSSPANHHNRPISDFAAISVHSSPASGLAATSVASNNNNSSNNNASFGGGTSGSSSGASDCPEREPLSPGGQLYKQRSIRATLAPKYTTDRGSSSGQKANDSDRSAGKTSNEAKPSTTNHSTPSTASMVSSEPKSSPYHHQASNERVAVSVNTQRSGPDRIEHLKSSEAFSFNQAARQSQQQQQPPPPAIASSAGGHHKSSKYQSRHSSQQQQRSQSDSSRSHGSSSSQSQLDQVMTNESYVSVLNHCFDDIEKFIIRLQQAVAAARELQVKRKSSKRASGHLNDVVTKNGEPILGKNGAPLPSILPLTAAELAMLSARARGPSEDDYFEILSKFKLAFNLLAKLKGCIHEPNAPELVHFLFTPLAIIIEAARNATPPVDPALVGIPYLNQDALDLLSNCCTSKESDMWLSLGPNWTETIDLSLLRASRLPSSFQPIFSDGWAPIIGELELIGLVAQANHHHQQATGKGGVHAGAKDCLTPLAATGSFMNEGHNHRYRQQQQHHQRHAEGRRHAQHYGFDESFIQSASSVSSGHLMDQHSAGMSNNGGRSENPKNVGSHKTKRNAPNPPLETLPMESLSPPQPYLDSAKYGYVHGPNVDTAECAYRAPDHYRNGSHSSEVQSNRRSNKQSSRNADFNHCPASSHYPLPPPPMAHNEDGHLDIDLLAQRNANMLHSDDYTELHHDAGPSQYRADRSHHHHHHHQRYSKATNPARHSGSNIQRGSYGQQLQVPPFEPDYLSEVDHEAILLDLGPAQTDWFFELQSRGAIIVRVLFTRDANNEKELSVRRGEILELIDDSRKWWRVRNVDLQIAHVPHTIVAIMQGYQTLEELLANNPNSDELSDEDSSPINSQRFSKYAQHRWHERDKHNSKTAGAFRYF